MKKIKLITPILGFTTLLGAATATVGCSCSHIGGDEPEPIETVDFNTCDWSIVVDACNKLENGTWTDQQFCQRFKFGDAQATSLDDFVGKKRTIELNGWDHEVIVIGCQQDYMGGDNTNPVALTLQFNNLISRNSDKKKLNTTWDPSGSANYWTSTLNKNLNSEEDVTWSNDENEKQSVYSMIAETENVLATNIKSVYRGVNTDVDGDSTYELDTRTTKLFCPTLANYFSDTGINNSDPSLYPDEDKVLYCQEGEQYKYYANSGMIEDEEIIPLDDPYIDCLYVMDCSGGDGVYWLSSPHFGVSNSVFRVDSMSAMEGGMISAAGANMTDISILPCFCI